MLRLLGGLVVLLMPATLAPQVVTPPVAQAADTRPNLVLLTTDDMRRDDLEWMPHTRELLGQLSLTQFVSNHPMCCPARAELLTGQLAQNSGVFHNDGPFGGYQSLKEKDNTLASWLSDEGYRTGFVGKFVNGWEAELNARPQGWTAFHPWESDLYAPYDRFSDWNDGDPRFFPGVHTNDAVTQVVGEKLRQFAGEQPFFIWGSYVAPHAMDNGDAPGKWHEGGPVPAERHAGLRLPAPPYMSKPSYTHPAGETTRAYKFQWRQRIRSLQSVDEGVRDTVQALARSGELDDTVIVFLSDNGFVLGEHGAHGKNLPWEESLQVPLLARGPGVGVGMSSKAAMMTDVAPSLAALAGVTPGRAVDGHAGLFGLDGGWQDVLIQAGNKNHVTHFWWRGTRTSRWTYVHWIGGRKELYDRVSDPYQLTNLAGRRPRVEARLARLTPNPY